MDERQRQGRVVWRALLRRSTNDHGRRDIRRGAIPANLLQAQQAVYETYHKNSASLQVSARGFIDVTPGEALYQKASANQQQGTLQEAVPKSRAIVSLTVDSTQREIVQPVSLKHAFSTSCT